MQYGQEAAHLLLAILHDQSLMLFLVPLHPLFSSLHIYAICQAMNCSQGEGGTESTNCSVILTNAFYLLQIVIVLPECGKIFLCLVVA